MKARQLDLIPADPVRPARLLKRRGSRFWQCRFWAGGRWQQRSTFTGDRMSAEAVLHCWEKQFRRRGKPQKKAVFADHV